jgi:hypothetical protein
MHSATELDEMTLADFEAELERLPTNAGPALPDPDIEFAGPVLDTGEELREWVRTCPGADRVEFAVVIGEEPNEPSMWFNARIWFKA